MKEKRRKFNLFFKILLSLGITTLVLITSQVRNNQPGPTSSPQVQSNSALTGSECDQASLEPAGDDLALLLDQPKNEENNCLFVGCNSFF